MLLPAILSIAIVGVPYLFISLKYYLSSRVEKQEKKYEPANNNKEQAVIVVEEKQLDGQGATLQTADHQAVPQQQGNASIQSGSGNPNDIPQGSQSRIFVKDIKVQRYKRWQNIFLVISCIIFIQSIIGRIYVKSTKNKIEIPEFFILSAINAGFVIILFNCIYSGLLLIFGILFDSRSQETQIIARFFLVFYGLSMTFPIYAGLDDFIKLDFITSIIAIIYSVFIQYGVMKIKKLENWPTYIDFNNIK